jgi:hypothetical protein
MDDTISASPAPVKKLVTTGARPGTPASFTSDLFKANDMLGHVRNEETIEYNSNEFWRTTYDAIELEDL